MPQLDNAVQMFYLSSQSVDLQAQINYIKELPAIRSSGKLADPNRIAILGHSFGGALIIFTNQHDYGQNVAIDVSGAELSWGDGDPEGEPNNPYWEIDLKAAMRDQQLPMYLLQPRNGRTLEPMLDLFRIAINKKYPSQAAIFPDAPWERKCSPAMSCWNDETGEPEPEWKQAHESFIGKMNQLSLWGPSVIDFINRYPRP